MKVRSSFVSSGVCLKCEAFVMRLCCGVRSDGAAGGRRVSQWRPEGAAEAGEPMCAEESGAPAEEAAVHGLREEPAADGCFPWDEGNC